MANKTHSAGVIQQKEVFVKSNAVLKEMERAGQLEPYTKYYTPDEDDVNLCQLRAKLLWTNPNINSAFGAQTVTFENDEIFDYFLIISRYNISVDSYVSHFGEVNKGIHITDVRAKSGSHFAMYERAATTTQTSVTFSEADEQYTDGSFVVSNTVLVPYQIIGLKKTPAAIYTGAELHEGNGISIKSGVVGIVPAQAVALNTTRTGQNDTVVEYAVTDSGNTWYRKWASGWKECGGTVAGSANAGDTITLPVTFSTLNFTTIMTVSNAVGAEGTGGFGGNFPGINVVTYNKIHIDKYTTTTYPHNYYCCGF